MLYFVGAASGGPLIFYDYVLNIADSIKTWIEILL